MSVRAASSEVLGDGWALVDQCVEDPIELGVHSVGIGLVIDRVKQRLTQPTRRPDAGVGNGMQWPYADLIMVLGLEGLRWGEVAELQVGDRLSVPGPWTAAVNNGTGQ
jgi:hypothetical protein